MTPFAHTVALVRLARATGIATPRRRMPRQQYPHLVETEYLRVLLSLVHAARAVIDPLLERLDHISSDEAVALIEDARRRIGAAGAALTPRLSWFATRTIDHHAAQMDAQCRAALGVGIDMLGVPRHTVSRADARGRRAEPPGVDERIAGFISENVALIKSLGDTPLEQVEQLVTRAFATGARHETLASEIVARFGVAEDRAAVIARDQIGKLNGRISSDRHQRMGLSRFIWRDVGDRRVRPAHRHLSGTTWAYAAPPSEGLPGEPIQCRCHDEPIFDDILAELDRLERGGGPLTAPVLAPAPRVRPGESPDAPGFLAPPGKRVVIGAPARAALRARDVYVLHPAELAGRLIALPGGGQDEVRMARARHALATGGNAPVKLYMLPDGQLFVDDGRHRLLAALEQGRPVLATIGKASPNTAVGTVPLVKR